MTPCRFTFDHDAIFDGFAFGTTWNGFDNVAVTRETLQAIVAYFGDSDPDTAAANRDMLAIEPMPDGLISLSHGYATVIVDG